MNLLRTIRMVLWSFFGIRQREGAEQEATRVKPLALIAVALVLVMVFVAGLVLLALTAGRAFAAQPAPVPDTIAQRVQACVGCHGKEGRATPDGYFPRIAGKPPAYLYHQLVAFRDGQRKYGAMSYLLGEMTDTYLLEIANHFGTLDVPYPQPAAPTSPANERARGKQLVVRGDPQRGIPACAGCHGEALMGMSPAVPALLGLPRDYLLAQMGAWRNGERRAAAPDCMADIARRLAPQEIAAAASWLAAQSVPAGAKAAPAGARPLPVACGSNVAPAVEPAREAGQLERGAYLARIGNCAGCHTEIGGKPYAGGRAIETPFGSVYASNLTPQVDSGIGGWSAGDFWRALHEGKAKDGRLLYPAFPYPNYTHLTREDSDALYAFLRRVPPVARPNTPHALRFPYGTQAALLAWRAMFFSPGTFTPEPAKDAQWNRGAYLVRGLGHCSACHAPRNALGASVGGGALIGGLMPVQRWYAPSLESPQEGGVANWPAGDIVALLRTGKTAHASTLGPMAEVVAGSTQYLSDADALAIAAYLRGLAQTPPAPRREDAAPARELLSRGGRIYANRCAGCHGEEGQGAGPGYPALAGNRAVTLASPANVLHAIADGGFPPTTPGNPRPFGMPPFGLELDNGDIAAVASYVRWSWGNQAPPVSELDVLRLR